MTEITTLVYDVTDQPLGTTAPVVTDDNAERAAPGGSAQTLPAAFFQSTI